MRVNVGIQTIFLVKWVTGSWKGPQHRVGRLCTQPAVGDQGEKTTVQRQCHCMKIVVFFLSKRGLDSLPYCLLVCSLVVLLVVLEWTATIAGDHVGLFLSFFFLWGEKFWMIVFHKAEMESLKQLFTFSNRFVPLNEAESGKNFNLTHAWIELCWQRTGYENRVTSQSASTTI